jgi:diadenosine tetraphosphate (Ap4A) HIT family hydrolase
MCKEHVKELHLLSPKTKIQFLKDMALVGEAVFNAFKPDKLNYELLGNTDRNHLHWHIFPRRNSDPGPQGTVWLRGRDVVYAEESRPGKKELEELKSKLLIELDKLI